jgi:exodeoxyribonuclease VII large subunit
LVRCADGRAVRSASAVQPGDRLDLEFGDGRVEAEALNVSSGDSKRAALAAVKGSAPPPASGVRRTRGRGGSSQGSLF